MDSAETLNDAPAEGTPTSHGLLNPEGESNLKTAMKPSRIEIIVAQLQIHPRTTHKDMKVAVGKIGNEELCCLMKQARRILSAAPCADTGGVTPVTAEIPTPVQQAVAKLCGVIIAALMDVRQQENDSWTARSAVERAKFDEELAESRAEEASATRAAEELAQHCDELEAALQRMRDENVALEGYVQDHLGLLSQSQCVVEQLTRRVADAANEQDSLRQSLALEAARAEEFERALATSQASGGDLQRRLNRALSDVAALRAELASCSARRALAEDAAFKAMATLTGRATITSTGAHGPNTGEERSKRPGKHARTPKAKA